MCGKGGVNRPWGLLVALVAGLLPAGCQLPIPHHASKQAVAPVLPPAPIGTITLNGDVMSPQSLAIPPAGMSLLEAINRAGGFSAVNGVAKQVDVVMTPAAPPAGVVGPIAPNNVAIAQPTRVRKIMGEDQEIFSTDEYVSLQRKSDDETVSYLFPIASVTKASAGQILLRDGDLITLLPAQDTSLYDHRRSVDWLRFRDTVRAFSVHDASTGQTTQGQTGPGVQTLANIMSTSNLQSGVLVVRRSGANGIPEVIVVPIADDRVYTDEFYDSQIATQAFILDDDKIEITLLERLPIVLQGVVRQTLTAARPTPQAGGLCGPDGRLLNKDQLGRDLRPVTDAARTVAGPLAIPGRMLLGPRFGLDTPSLHAGKKPDVMVVPPVPRTSILVPNLPPGAEVVVPR